MSGILVYGVIRSSHRDSDALVREAGGDLRILHGQGALSAVIREVDDDATLNDDDVAAYLNALVTLMSGGPIIPIQFGTIAPDEDSVCCQVLDPVEEDLLECLHRFEGMVEVRLTIDADTDAEIARTFEEWPELQRMARAHRHGGDMEYRIELGRETGVLLCERRDRLSDSIRARLEEHAESYALLASYGVSELRHAYLVRADTLESFDERVGEIRHELGQTYRFEYVGPLPPFSFTQVVLRQDADRAQWGF